MDSRRNFLRGLARAASGAGAAAPSDAKRARDLAAPDRPSDASAAARPPESAPAHPAGPVPGEASVEAHPAIGRAAVLVIGAGALGAPVLGYLAGAGVGRLGVLDDALVATPDLRTETLHYSPDVGVAKAHSAAAKLAFLNPEIVIEPYQVRIAADNVEGLLVGQDLVVDCSNEEATQVLVARTCARLGIPLVAGTMVSAGGRVISAPGNQTACPQCPGSLTARVGSPAEGAAAGVLGSLQAHETLTRLVEAAEPPPGRVVTVDLEAPALRREALVHRPGCSICADR